MRKFILMLVAIATFTVANAQIATENAKLFDNVYVGVEGGVATPLNFDGVFPLNTVAGLKIGKEFTPLVGVEVEGQVFFNDNNFQRWTQTFVKGTNLGVNGTLNLNNLFAGYNGTPRLFEVKANAGISWLHFWNGGGNGLGAKTALDFNFNLGKKRAHTLFISPGVYWNLQNGPAIQFNKEQAQLALMAGYVYHFKTSNGTHHFKTYDVGAMSSEINRLYKENLELMDRANKTPEKVVVTKVKEKLVKEIQYVNGTVVVNFAKNSYQLTDEAKEVLDNVTGKVDILGYASPEGTKTYNQKLSQKRADVVSEYLKERGVEVNSAVGYGSIGNSSNRIVIVKCAEGK